MSFLWKLIQTVCPAPAEQTRAGEAATGASGAGAAGAAAAEAAPSEAPAQKPATEAEFFAVLEALKADGTYDPLVMGTIDQWESATMGHLFNDQHE